MRATAWLSAIAISLIFWMGLVWVCMGCNPMRQHIVYNDQEMDCRVSGPDSARRVDLDCGKGGVFKNVLNDFTIIERE